MSVISISHLNFSYEDGENPVFEDLSLSFDDAWKIGISGRNGRGKTTLLKILNGDLKGKGKIDSTVSFQYFSFDVEKTKTVREIANLRAEEEWKLMKEFHGLSLDRKTIDRVLDTLSQGEQTKVLLAMLFLKRDIFPLIDEPTNHLDLEGREAVGRYLKKKSGFILVSHDGKFLDACIDHILVYQKSGLAVYQGNFSAFIENRNRSESFEMQKKEKLNREIDRLMKARKETMRWAEQVEKTKNGTRNSGLKPDKGYIGHRAAKMMKRSKVIERHIGDRIEEKKRLLTDTERSDPLEFHPLKAPWNPVLKVETILESVPLRFQLHRGERLAICGKNGSGKSTLIRRIVERADGIYMNSGCLISQIVQDTSAMRGKIEDRIKKNLDSSVVKAVLDKLDFPSKMYDRRIETLSEGEKKKVAVALSIATQAHLYLWDEPLNYLDFEARQQISEMLIHSGATVIFVEHDRYFIEKVATRRLVLERDRFVLLSSESGCDIV